MTPTTEQFSLLSFIIIFVQMITSADGQCSSVSLVNFTNVEDTVYVVEGREAFVNLTILDVREDGRLTFESTSPGNFELKDVDAYFDLSTNRPSPFTVSVEIVGKFIAIEDMLILYTPTDSPEEFVVGSQTVGVRRPPNILQQIYIYVVLVWVAISYISMGGSMDFKAIWQKVRRPWGVIIGIFCQFIIMPAMTYVIARLLPGDDPTIAIGVVLIGTCPGGWLSNIFAVLLDVDFILSVTMTFFSSIIALGMMPLNLLIYATPFTGGNARLSTPYDQLAIQLALLVIPCFFGIGLTYKFPKFKYYCLKVIKPISAILIIVGIGLAVPADLYAFTSSPAEIWIAAVITPICGAFFGLSLARIPGLKIRTSITIALETGIQNALLGRTIVGLYYPQPEADLMARVQLVTVMVTIIEGTVASIVYSLVRYVMCRSRCDRILEVDDDDKEAIVGVVEVEATSVIHANGDTPNPANSYDVGTSTNPEGIDNATFEMKETD